MSEQSEFFRFDPLPPPAGDPRRDHREMIEEGAQLAAAGWPPALVKAVFDSFQYAAFVLHLGEVEFESAEDAGGGWVRLRPGDVGGPAGRLSFPFPRGVEVRLEDIRWVADAPSGS